LIERLGHAVEYPTEQAVADADGGLFLLDPNAAAWSQAAQLAQGHQQGPVIAVADDLGGNDLAVLERKQFTEGTDGGTGAGALDHQADDTVHLAVDTDGRKGGEQIGYVGHGERFI
jgi:hypothetical protein